MRRLIRAASSDALAFFLLTRPTSGAGLPSSSVSCSCHTSYGVEGYLGLLPQSVVKAAVGAVAGFERELDCPDLGLWTLQATRRQIMARRKSLSARLRAT